MAGRENGARISGYLSAGAYRRLKKEKLRLWRTWTVPSPQRKQAPAIKTMALSLPFVCERKAVSHWQTSVPVKTHSTGGQPPSLQLSTSVHNCHRNSGHYGTHSVWDREAEIHSHCDALKPTFLCNFMPILHMRAYCSSLLWWLVILVPSR